MSSAHQRWSTVTPESKYEMFNFIHQLSERAVVYSAAHQMVKFLGISPTKKIQTIAED